MWPFDPAPDQTGLNQEGVGLPADQSGWGGMFSPGSFLSNPDFRRHAAYDALTNAGLGLIAASAPSSTPTNLGTMFGSLAGGAAQGVQNSADRYMKMAQAGMQMRNLQMQTQMYPQIMKALADDGTPAAAPQQAAAAPVDGGVAGNAIAGIESAGGPSGGYGSVGPVATAAGNRAYGKYQVLDSNIPDWTKEVLGKEMTPKEFLADPQAQEAVFKAKFGQYVQQAGGDRKKAAQMWFAGPGGADNPNAADVNGMTVAKYGQQFAANGGAGQQPAQGDNPNAAPGQPPVQLAQAGPQLPPPPQPIPIPKALMAAKMVPQLKDAAQAKIDAINHQNTNAMERWKANTDLLKFNTEQARHRETMEQTSRNQKVTPAGTNKELSAAEAEIEMAKKQAESAAHEKSVFGGPNWQDVPPDQFRKLANPQVVALADGLQSGQNRLSTLGNSVGRGGTPITKSDVLTAGQKLYGKDFNPDAGDIRYEFEKNATDTSHQLGKTIYSINTAYKHLNTFQDLVLAQKNGDKPMINNIIKAWNDQTGSAKYTSAETLQHALGTELAAVIKGQQLNMPEVDSAVETLKTTKSEPQMLAAVNVLRHAMGDRETTITDEAAAHYVPPERIAKLIGPTARNAITHFDKVQMERAAPPQAAATPAPVSQMPLLTSPAEAAKLGKGAQFRFMQNGQEMIGTVP